MINEWMRHQDSSPEARRLYEQERLVVWVTEAIAATMEEKGISRAQLAEMLGSSRANVTQILSGSRNMTLRTLSDLAWALEARVDVELAPLPAQAFTLVDPDDGLMRLHVPALDRALVANSNMSLAA